jgi:hypothetical protein
MPVPTSYTEAQLAAFMHSQLGDFPALFGWTSDLANYQETVNETMIAYGVSTIASATNIQKLRALARVEAWKQVLAKLANKHGFQADGATFNRQQMYEMAKQNLDKVETDALVFMDGYQITTGTVTWSNDPYKYPEDEV